MKLRFAKADGERGQSSDWPVRLVKSARSFWGIYCKTQKIQASLPSPRVSLRCNQKRVYVTTWVEWTDRGLRPMLLVWHYNSVHSCQCCQLFFSILWYKSCKILNLSLERYWMYLNTVCCVQNSTVCTLFGQIVCSLTSYVLLLNQPGFCLTGYNLPVFNHYRKTHFITVGFLCWDIVWSLFINKKDLCSPFQHLVQTSHKTHFLLSLLKLGGQRIWMSSWDEGTKKLDPFKWHLSNSLSIHNFIICTAPIH